LGEVSHLAVERQHHAAFEKDTVLPLQARQFGVGLRRGAGMELLAELLAELQA
jgi:hypothetical protein